MPGWIGTSHGAPRSGSVPGEVPGAIPEGRPQDFRGSSDLRTTVNRGGLLRLDSNELTMGSRIFLCRASRGLQFVAQREIILEHDGHVVFG